MKNIACDLSVFTPNERSKHFSVFDEIIIGRASSVKESTEGFSLSYPASTELFAQISKWMEEESRCCPFLTFSLTIDAKGKGYSLFLGGDAEVKQFLADNVLPRLDLLPKRIARSSEGV